MTTYDYGDGNGNSKGYAWFGARGGLGISIVPPGGKKGATITPYAEVAYALGFGQSLGCGLQVARSGEVWRGGL